MHYFPFYGRAEPIRMLFHKAGVTDYEDVIHTFEEWPALKKEGGFEFKAMPVLFITDPATGEKKQYCQTHAILRFLGKKYGYYPEDPEVAYQVDSDMDAWNDLLMAMIKIHWAKDEEAKKAAEIELATGALPTVLGALSARLEKNASRGRFLVGSGLTIADFLFGGMLVNLIFNELNTTQSTVRPIFEQYEQIMKYKEAFCEEFAEYLVTRPKRER